MRAALALLVFLGACTDVTQDAQPLPMNSEFAILQPYIEGRCATLDCHGASNRPLRFYAETGLRAAGDLRDMPLTVEELEANAEALRGIDPTAEAEQHLAVLKALDPDAGGLRHEGGTVWPSREDPAAHCLVGWLRAEPDDETWREHCVEVGRQWAPPLP